MLSENAWVVFSGVFDTISDVSGRLLEEQLKCRAQQEQHQGTTSQNNLNYNFISVRSIATIVLSGGIGFYDVAPARFLKGSQYS